MERTLGHVDTTGDLGCPGEVVESNKKRQEEDNQKDTDDEQESEYDTESENELPATVDSDLEDEMTFLRGVTTRSGRTIRVTSKFFYLFRFHHVHCTVLRGQRTSNTITEKVREQDLKLPIVLRLDLVPTDLKL